MKLEEIDLDELLFFVEELISYNFKLYVEKTYAKSLQ